PRGPGGGGVPPPRAPGHGAPSAAKGPASGADSPARPSQASSDAGPATAAASAGSAMTPVPSTAPTYIAVPWTAVSRPAGAGAATASVMPAGSAGTSAGTSAIASAVASAVVRGPHVLGTERADVVLA